MPRRPSKCVKNVYFSLSSSSGRITRGYLVLFRRDLIDNRDTIGGDMCNTTVINGRFTFILVDDNRNMIVVNAQEGPTAVVYYGVSSGEYDISGLEVKVD